MSERHRKSRGITRSVVQAGDVLRPRRSRHGRVQVGYAPAGSDDKRDSPYVRPAVTRKVVKENPTTGEYEVVVEVLAPARPMTVDEVQAERARVRRALAPTTTYGLKNEVEHMTPRGKSGAKPLPGAR